MSEDLAHDAHLRAALRHAPDHALSPPSGLSQTILAAARQAHQPVRPSAAPPPVRMRAAGSHGLNRWLQRLFAARWAGAWAAGLVAALGLGLWLDLGMQPVLEPPPAVAMDNAPPPASPRSDAARAPTTSGDAATSDAQSATSLAKAAAPPPAPAPAPAMQRTPATATPGTTAPTARARTAERSSEPRKEMASATQRDADATPPVAEPAMRQQAAVTEATAQGAVAATAPADSQPADRVVASRAAAATPQPTAAPPTSPEARANEQPFGAMAPRAALTQRHADKAEKLGAAVAAASPALTLLRRAQAEIASGGARWTWATPGAAAVAPFDDAAQAWLSRVVQSAAGRWVEVNERGEALAALEVRWWRDGWPHATLRLEADGLRWIEPNGRIRYAPLDAATLQRLRSF